MLKDKYVLGTMLVSWLVFMLSLLVGNFCWSSGFRVALYYSNITSLVAVTIMLIAMVLSMRD